VSALDLSHAQLRPLAIADLAGALQYSLPENAELDATGILRRSADSREIVHRPGDHKVGIELQFWWHLVAGFCLRAYARKIGTPVLTNR